MRGGSVRADADVRVQLVDYVMVLICVNSLRLAMLPEVGEHVQVMTRSCGRGQDVRRRGVRRQRALLALGCYHLPAMAVSRPGPGARGGAYL